MRRRGTVLAATLAALFTLEVPLCAAACSGPGAGHASPAVATADTGPPPCHQSPEPAPDHADCGASCLHQAQAASVNGVDMRSAPPAVSPPGDPPGVRTAGGCPLSPVAESRRIPPLADLLLLKSTLLL